VTFNEFNDFQQKLFDECIQIRDTKGKEYANSDDRFANFNRLRDSLGLTNVQIGWVYATKHFDSIAQAIKTKQYTGRAEPIRGRIVDAIVYLTLIAGMIEEVAPKLENSPKIVSSNLDGTLCTRCFRPFQSNDTIYSLENYRP
jgi:hypothetical protein